MAVVVLLPDLRVKGGDFSQMLFTEVLYRFFFCRGKNGYENKITRGGKAMVYRKRCGEYKEETA